MNLPASGGMSSHFPAPPFTWIVIYGMMSGLLRVIVLLMASLSSLSGAPRLDVALSPGFTVEDALRASFGETPRTVVLHGVNGAEAPHAVVQACRNEEGLFFVFHCSDRNVVSPGREDGLDHSASATPWKFSSVAAVNRATWKSTPRPPGRNPSIFSTAIVRVSRPRPKPGLSVSIP